MLPQNTPVPTATRQLIKSRLTSIANEQNIRILYACESGSRAWGFPSPDSDYDVRFIYVHSLDWYLKLGEDRDVIDLPLENTPAGILDLGGWDLRKTLRLLGKSNPVIWEWLQSPICYLDEKILRESHDVFDPFFSPIAGCHHYLGICRNTMSQGLFEPTVKIKKYFYMLRPLLAAAWIERYRSIPPMELEPLLALLDDRQDVICSIRELQNRKQNIDEQVPIPRITTIDQFLASEMSRLQEAAKSLPVGDGDRDKLDAFFRKSIIQ